MRSIPLLLCFILVGCFQFAPGSQIEPVPAATTAVPDDMDTWQLIAPALEQRTYRHQNTIIQAIRIDPQYYHFRVHYQPGEPLTIQQWQAQLLDAVLIVNANFFTPQHTALGLIISDSISYGQSYTDRGGTFFVQDGTVGIRSNIQQPYHGEAYQQAIQAFPMLILNRSQAYTNRRDNRPTRRTIIGQDTQGRIIIMATPGFGIGLFDLSAYLPTTDIAFTNAFNLDGGGSTMWYIAPTNTYIRSFDPVPAVLAVYAREE